MFYCINLIDDIFQFRMIMRILRLINIGKLLIKHSEAMAPRQCGELITDNKVDLMEERNKLDYTAVPKMAVSLIIESTYICIKICIRYIKFRKNSCRIFFINLKSRLSLSLSLISLKFK